MLTVQNASAQFQGGGVDHPGSWYVGEGFKKGDMFSYNLCHVDYKECANFQMDFWVEREIKVGTETKWLVQAVVYDGNKIVKGSMELGKIAPEPSGGSSELSVYRSAFKSSVVWLSAFANADEPRRFNMPSWGKIANIGGEQIIPKLIEPNGLTVPAKHFDEVIQVGWRTGGYDSKVWVVDNFPFPIKASTWTHVSEGIPPQEYRFELLSYKENISQNPFTNIKSTQGPTVSADCPKTDKLVKTIKKSTKNFGYQLHVFYAPETPVQNCPMTWQINFLNKFDDTEFLNQVQYDILVVDDNLKPLRSVAQDEGRLFLFSASGKAIVNVVIEEPVGTAHYAIWIYGLAPSNQVPSTSPDWLIIDIPISKGSSSTTPPAPTTKVPSWIKTTAGFWVNGDTSDKEFVSAIEFLIKEKIIIVPPTSASGSSVVEIPSWIKTTTKFWVQGATSDTEIVSAFQWLITNGIMKIA